LLDDCPEPPPFVLTKGPTFLNHDQIANFTGVIWIIGHVFDMPTHELPIELVGYQLLGSDNHAFVHFSAYHYPGQ
jgi:hypothetical protein